MKDFLLKHINLSEQGFADFFALSTKRHFKKGQIIFETPKIFNKLYFIEEGLIRCYRIKNGEDLTYHFYLAQEFCTDYFSYLTGSPSELFFEPLADTTVYEFCKSDIEMLMQDYPQIDKLGRLMAEKSYVSVAERLREIQVDSLEVRYQKLLNRNPKLFQEVQQRYIATYLGAKPESLSRIKSRLHKTR